VAGEWADDRRTGHGHYFYANGDEYIGDWQNHLRHGQGRYMYASSGLQYEGQWRDGKRTGDGEISRIGGQSVRLTHLERISDIVTLYNTNSPSENISGLYHRCNKNSSGNEIANVNFYAVRPETTRIRRNNAK